MYRPVTRMHRHVRAPDVSDFIPGLVVANMWRLPTGSVLPNKDLDLMMSLYADDVVLTDTAHDSKVDEGKEQVRAYWANVSGPFRPEHHWIGYTPAMRIKSHVSGNTGTLDFECLWMNVDDNTIGAHAFSSMEVARVKGHWLVKRIKVGKVYEL